MFKYKKFFIIFSLILSILCINITPVYCYDILDSGVNVDEENFGLDYDYNIFNANIIPFYVNKNTGVGWYYSGFPVEIAINDYYLNDYDITRDYIYENQSNFVYEFLNNYCANSDEDCFLNFQYNVYKTHLYYYDGSSLALYCMDNYNKLNINNIVDNCNVIENLSYFLYGSTGYRSYKRLCNSLKSDYVLINYSLVENYGSRGENFYGNFCFSSPITYLNKCSEDYYICNSQDCVYYGFQSFDENFNRTENKTVKNPDVNRNAGYIDLFDSYNMSCYISKSYIKDEDKDFEYTLNDYYYYELDDDVYGHESTNKNYELMLCYDFKDLTTNEYERVYITKTKLLNYTVFEDDYNFKIKIGDILNFSSFDNPQVQGCSLFWVLEDYDSKTTVDNINYLTFSKNYYISTQSYEAYNYNDDNNYVPYNAKLYTINTNCNAWTLNYNKYLTDENGNNANTYDEVTAIGNTIINYLTDLISQIGNIPSALGNFFAGLPNGLLSLIILSFALFIVSCIIKYFKS